MRELNREDPLFEIFGSEGREGLIRQGPNEQGTKLSFYDMFDAQILRATDFLISAF